MNAIAMACWRPEGYLASRDTISLDARFRRAAA